MRFAFCSIRVPFVEEVIVVLHCSVCLVCNEKFYALQEHILAGLWLQEAPCKMQCQRQIADVIEEVFHRLFSSLDRRNVLLQQLSCKVSEQLSANIPPKMITFTCR